MKIAIIGAGPRGIATALRLIEWQRQILVDDNKATKLEIKLFDKYPIGGHVWRLDQSPHLIMNTPMAHTTLYADSSVQMHGPVSPGLSLYEWSQKYTNTFLGPNDYAPRFLYGEYQQYVVKTMTESLPESVNFEFIQSLVSGLDVSGMHYTVLDEYGQGIFTADKVIIATGHFKNDLTEEQHSLLSFAQKNNNLYLPPSFPGDVDLSPLPAGENVLMRGLGLSFYDYLTELTTGRGGKFLPVKNGLLYQKSGAEPHIFAGSRRGFPYFPKADNQKAFGQKVLPSFLTEEKMTELGEQGKLTAEVFFGLMKREIELEYYRLLLKKSKTEKLVEQFAQAYVATDQPNVLINEIFSGREKLDLDFLFNPEQKALNSPDYQVFMVTILERLIEDAKEGNLTGPITGALEVFKDLRNQVRFAVEHGYFSDEDYLDFVIRRYTPLQNFIATGPPEIRLEQLLALIKAGIVEIIPPGMQVTTGAGQFEAISTRKPQHQYQARYLVDAQIPGNNNELTKNPLIKNLLRQGLLSLDTRVLPGGSSYQTGALNVDNYSDLAINTKKETVPDLYLWGIPTDGKHWFTSVSFRPGVNDTNFITADRIAEQILTDNYQYDAQLRV